MCPCPSLAAAPLSSSSSSSLETLARTHCNHGRRGQVVARKFECSQNSTRLAQETSSELGSIHTVDSEQRHLQYTRTDKPPSTAHGNYDHTYQGYLTSAPHRRATCHSRPSIMVHSAAQLVADSSLSQHLSHGPLVFHGSPSSRLILPTQHTLISVLVSALSPRRLGRPSSRPGDSAVPQSRAQIRVLY